jgi:hypothetical protein
MVCAPEGFQQNGQPTTVGLCLPRGLLDRPEANPDGDGLPWQLRDPKSYRCSMVIRMARPIRQESDRVQQTKGQRSPPTPHAPL